MSKKVLILSGSPRKNGNSDTLCNEFMRGALESGNDVEKVFLHEQTIGFCNACFHCEKNGGVCAIQDDMAQILQKMHWADVIVMASPVYFYSIDAQMKALIDRCFSQYAKIQNKEFYYIMTSGAASETVMDCSLQCFRGLVSCLKGSREMGIICGKGVYEADAVKATPFMEEAYHMGKGV